MIYVHPHNFCSTITFFTEVYDLGPNPLANQSPIGMEKDQGWLANPACFGLS
jgi:hypothetical protein